MLVNDTIIMPQPHDKQDIKLPKKIDPSFDKFRSSPEIAAEEERLRNQLELLKQLSSKKEKNKTKVINTISTLPKLPEIVSQDLAKMAHLIARDCKNAMGVFIFQKYKPVLYRGIKNNDAHDFLQGESHTERKPSNTKPEVQEFFDKILVIGGFTALRKNSISCTIAKHRAPVFGTCYLIFPFDDCNYTFSEKEPYFSEKLSAAISPSELMTLIFDNSSTRLSNLYEFRYLRKDLKNEYSEINQKKLGVAKYPKAKRELILVLNRVITLLENDKPISPALVTFLKKRISKLVDDRKYNQLISTLQEPPMVEKALTVEGTNEIIKKLRLKNEQDYSYEDMLFDAGGEVMISGKYYAVNAKYEQILKNLLYRSQ